MYTGHLPKGLLSFGGILGGGKTQPIPGAPAAKVGCGADTPRSTTWMVDDRIRRCVGCKAVQGLTPSPLQTADICPINPPYITRVIGTKRFPVLGRAEWGPLAVDATSRGPGRKGGGAGEPHGPDPPPPPGSVLHFHISGDEHPPDLHGLGMAESAGASSGVDATRAVAALMSRGTTVLLSRLTIHLPIVQAKTIYTILSPKREHEPPYFLCLSLSLKHGFEAPRPMESDTAERHTQRPHEHTSCG